MATPDERSDLLDKLRAHHEELVATVQGHDDESLLKPPLPGEWSALQQVEHLMLSVGIWTAMAERAASEDEPDLADLWASLRQAEEPNPFPPPAEPRSRDDLLSALEDSHARTLALVKSLPDDAFTRRGRNAGFGDLTVLQMLRAIYRHHRMHIDQIEGREPSFPPRRAAP